MISCYFGATEHGKSFHVENNIIPNFKKVVVFAPEKGFRSQHEFWNPNDREFLKIFQKFRGQESFKIVIRTTSDSDDQVIFNKTVFLALELGKMLGKEFEGERVQLIVDEAGSICSAHYMSQLLKKVVTKGRHNNVDTHFIVQNPMVIHGLIRSQATKICSFYLSNASSIPTFNMRFSREICEKIMALPKFWRFEWSSNEEMAIFDERNKIRIKFPKKTLILSEKTAQKRSFEND